MTNKTIQYRRRWSYTVATYCALASFGISFATFMGYVLSYSNMTSWGPGSAMALNTSVALMLVSVGVLLLALRKD